MERLSSKNFLLILFILMLILGFFMYWPTLKIGFLSDDWGYAYLAKQSGYADGFKYFITPDPYGAGKGNFRPLSSFFAIFAWKPFLSLPAILHIFSVILFVLVSWLVSCLFFTLFKNKTGSMLAGLIFLFFPLNTEVVSWLSAANALLCTLPLLLALIIYAKIEEKKYWPWLVWLLIIISLAAKEYALLFALFALIIDVLKRRKIKWGYLLSFIILDIIYFIWRFLVLGKLGGYLAADQQSAHLALNKENILLYAKLPLFYLYRYFNQLAAPKNLAAFAQRLMPLIAAAGLAEFAIKKTSRESRKNDFINLALLTLLVFAGNLLGWNLVNPADPATIHSRILFVSNIWFAVLLGYIFMRLKISLSQLFLMIYLLLLPALTFYQIQPWVKAGIVSAKINGVLAEEVKKNPAEIAVTNLPDNYQGAFIYRNGLEFAAALLSDTAKGDLKITKTMQPGLEKEISVNGRIIP